MSFISLLINSIKMFVRDWRALFFSLFLPVMFMVIFGLANFGEYSNPKVGVINEGENQELLDNIKKIDILDVKTDNAEDMKNSLKKGDLDLIIVLPKDLVKINMIETTIPGLENLPTYLQTQIPKIQKPEYKTTELIVYTNKANAQKGQTALTILKEIFTKLNFKVTSTPEIFSFKEESLSESTLGYLDFIVPGIIAMSIMQMSLMSIIFTIVGYREKGVLKRLQITPIKSFEFTSAQVVTRLLISISQIAILIAVAVLAFDVKITGSYALITLLTILGAAVFIAMGLSVSGIAKTQDTAAPLANILMMPMMFLGNVFFPVSTMPSWIQNIVNYLPLNHLSNAMREVMTNNASFSMVSQDIYALIIWAIIMIVLAAFTFRWKTID